MEYCKIHNEDHIVLVSIIKLWETEDKGENLEIRLEKLNDGETYAEFTLPAYHCHHAYGFRESELIEMEHFLRDNAATIWRMGRGELSAESVA